MFKIVQTSYSDNFGVNALLQGLGEGVVSYALGANMALIEEMLL